jgi:hypothetical protein
MGIEHKPHDDAIDKTLAALKRTAPPEGMEARILQRLQQHASTAIAAPFRWRDLLTGSALAAAWWRGALSGAATAVLLVGALLMAQHGLRARQPVVSQITATRTPAPTAVPVAALSQRAAANDLRAKPCTTSGAMHVRIAAPARSTTMLSAASFAPSHPAPVLPLTAQERALVRLVQTADPKLLAALSPETQAKVDAQEADNYNKFFTPPTAPPQPADNASPTDTQQPAQQQGEQI